ncbi:activin receptor type-2B-like [Ostrinia furnacalis]|uniref:activin receptor type-2B-like n=1 Tax=Ostrinia furnacalis TaxID=93504 RepID=UPI00103AB16B|nr:activin receptor type-2B-like [Ostrinia furnacalis]
MMENILSQRVTPLLKCIVLFLFIFTAKVLTSRPQESLDSRNGIHHAKPFHYVRTFTKYHHRRTIQWNNLPDFYWTTQDHPKVSKRSADPKEYNPYWLERHLNRKKSRFLGPVQEGNRKKRSVENSFVSEESESSYYWPDPQIKKRSAIIPNSNDFIGAGNSNNVADSKDVGSTETKAIGTSKSEGNVKNGLPEAKVKNKKVATTGIPPISCLYKLHRIAVSATPSYEDEEQAQMVVENYSYDIGPISETTLPNGDTAQVEQCTDTKATCYALWHRHTDGNITILGQGCWHSSQRDGRNTCDKCTPIDQMPGTKFCCCTREFCNADFLSLKEESVTIKAESTMDAPPLSARYSALAAPVLLVLAAILVKALVLRRLYCNRTPPQDDQPDTEKGEVMGSGPDALATGLLCVDNLTLIEHIGQGKFGSVWRGTLGSTPVAVKLYSNAGAWQKEAAIYALPHLSHSNLLLYYGSDTRATLTEGGGREHLLVLELCWGTLRARLERAPISWAEFAAIAHGVAAALAHLHTPTASKPCVVHRDVNSNNVLISSDGQPRLADLGLAQILHPRRETPSRITEAGTLRYLAPEALEGALDLSGARAALCAVDVFALGLVLWEALWRCRGAHPGLPPPYAPPYQHHGLPPRPTLQHMQTLVSRNKARPPLPKGPVPEARALKIANDTCDECWDHDAEARLTAVCVEERMAELKQMLQAPGPVIHDNNLHPHPPESITKIRLSPQ